MRGWAGGNFFLVSNTFYTTLMTMASIATLLGLPEWLMAPFRTRFTVFILACISTTVFTSSLFATVLTFIKNGRQVSLRNIVGFYFVYIQLGAFLPSTYIFLFESLALNQYSILNKNYGNWLSEDDSLIQF